MLNFDFKGQTAIVTGGTRGIGRAISEAFLKAGARVIATYAGNEAAARQCQEANQAYGAELLLRQCNVASYEQVEAFFRTLEKECPNGFEVLVNNAGIRKDAVLGMMNPQDWRAVLGVNLDGTFNTCKFAIQALMRKRYGRIINITSPCAQFGFSGQANYAASKAGQVALTRSLSKEVATRGITVNCVSPGFVATDLIKDLSPELSKQYLAQIPLKRFGNPEEVAACVLFLASKQASYVTGSVLEVTGGL